MEIFHKTTHIDFLGHRRWALPLTLAFIAISIGSFAVRGLSLGVDFTGGVVLEVGYPGPVELDAVRGALAADGFAEASAQHFGTTSEVLVRLPPEAEGGADAKRSDRVLAALQAAEPQAELRRVEFVGPQVGDELTEQGVIAAVVALAGIFVYLMFRFEWKFAAGAIAATVHDVIFVMGWFSLFHLDFDLTVLAAVLAVVGYSVNDTVVVFDRIRENFRTMRKGSPEEVMNAAVNQTLSRTIMTGVTTLAVLVALFYLGGEVIHGFALALIIGILVGTYSSVYVASATALLLGVTKQDLMPPKEEEGPDALP